VSTATDCVSGTLGLTLDVADLSVDRTRPKALDRAVVVVGLE